MSSTRSLLPPRKKDWKLGEVQVGLFLRYSDGRVLEMTTKDAPSSVLYEATCLLRAMLAKVPSTPTRRRAVQGDTAQPRPDRRALRRRTRRLRLGNASRSR